MPIPLKSAVSEYPESFVLEPDPFDEDTWVLEFATDRRGRVELSLSPTALHELHLEARSIPAAARRAGHTETCDICGGDVDRFLAIPNALGRPVHRECYADRYDAEWVTEFP